MTDSHAQFLDSIPENYDAHLGLLLFHFYGSDLARRVGVTVGGRVLELACGTGIFTQYLRGTLAVEVEIVATDLNEPMLDFARDKRGELENVSFEQADTLSLPFADGAVDAVVCQFGVMFFPDKEAGMREAARVLKSGWRVGTRRQHRARRVIAKPVCCLLR
ncbi:MAG: class I SAM-dependent methyltransferase [SAR324 cluster bacterium]|nr:class I SAM-dependent methyltransferase [SAR324 cluster bacterium]